MGKKERKYPLFSDWLNLQLGEKPHRWLADRIGRGRSTVTEYCSGFERPPKLIAARIIIMFGGNPLELADFLYYDPNEIIALCDSLNGSYQTISIFLKQSWTHLFNNQSLREGGKVQKALDSIDYWIELIDNRINSQIDPQTDIQALKHISIRFHGERMACISAISANRIEIPNEVTENFSKMVKYSIDLGESLNNVMSLDNRLSTFKALEGEYQPFSGLALSNSWMAAVYFVSRNYTKSVEYSKKALPYCGFDKNLLAESLRGLILGLAHLGRGDEFLQSEIEAQKLINRGVFEQTDIDSINCASAEGREILGKEGARTILKEILNPLEENRNNFTNRPLKLIQIFKSKLLIAESELQRGLLVDKDMLIEIADQGYSMAKTFGFERHAKEIHLLSNVFKNRSCSRSNKVIQLGLGL